MSSLSPEAAAGVQAGPCYSRFLPTQALFRAVLSFGRVWQPTTNPWERLTSSGKPKCSRSGNLKPAIVPWNFPRAFWAAKSRRWLPNIFNDFSWDAFFKMLSACWLFKPQKDCGLTLANFICSLILIFKFSEVFSTHSTLYHPPASPCCFFHHISALFLVLSVGVIPELQVFPLKSSVLLACWHFIACNCWESFALIASTSPRVARRCKHRSLK